MFAVSNEDIFKIILNKIKSSKSIYIYGAGLAARMGKKAMERFGISIKGFIDKDADGTKHLCGEKLLPLSSVEMTAQILIYANPEYKIHERLETAGYHNWIYCDPLYTRLYDNTYVERTYQQIISNRDKIQDVFELLSDRWSRIVYETVINQRINCSIPVQRFCELFNHNQYFGNDIVPNISGCYVDCGAYTGDTLQRFLKQVKNRKYSYHAFETDDCNSDQIEIFCRENGISDVEVHRMAVWDGEATLKFELDQNDQKVEGRCCISDSASGEIISANSIDNIVQEKIDMIGMDIEGAEIRAVFGAKSHIKLDHPILAISAYHRLEDLWEIPLEILKIHEDYSIYFRQHRWNMEDTVCYAIPKRQ